MTKEIIIKKDTGIQNEEWYQGLIEDCRAIIVERSMNAKMEVIEGKWELGQRITEENVKMDRKEIYGKKIIENLSRDLGASTTDLWNCVKFYKQLEVKEFGDVIAKLPEGKNVTWYKITLWLGGRTEEEKDDEKKSYRVSDILVAIRDFVTKTGNETEEEIEKAIEEFMRILTKPKK